MQIEVGGKEGSVRLESIRKGYRLTVLKKNGLQASDVFSNHAIESMLNFFQFVEHQKNAQKDNS